MTREYTSGALEDLSGEGWDEAVSSVRTILDADERLSVLRGESISSDILNRFT